MIVMIMPPITLWNSDMKEGVKIKKRITIMVVALMLLQIVLALGVLATTENQIQPRYTKDQALVLGLFFLVFDLVILADDADSRAVCDHALIVGMRKHPLVILVKQGILFLEIEHDVGLCGKSDHAAKAALFYLARAEMAGRCIDLDHSAGGNKERHKVLGAQGVIFDIKSGCQKQHQIGAGDIDLAGGVPLGRTKLVV